MAQLHPWAKQRDAANSRGLHWAKVWMYSAATRVVGTDQTSEAEKALQRQKLDEIIGVLLSSGYFRARIATLTPFDKVILPRRPGFDVLV